MTIPIIPTARKTNPAPALFFLDSISLRVSSDNLMTGYFLLPVRYKISPDDPFVFAAKIPKAADASDLWIPHPNLRSYRSATPY